MNHLRRGGHAAQVGLRWAIGMVVGGALAAAGVVSGAVAQTGGVELKETVYHLVGDGHQTTSHHNAKTEPSEHNLTNALAAHRNVHLRFVIFDSADLADRLSPGLKKQLLREFDDGKAVLCVDGSGSELKAAFGRLDDALAQTGTPTGEKGEWACIGHSPGDYIAELTIAAPPEHDGVAFREALSRLRHWWDEETQHRQVDGGALLDATATATGCTTEGCAWDQIWTHTWSNIWPVTWGSYVFRSDVFALDSAEPCSDGSGLDCDWYRIDFYTHSGMDDYEMTGNHFLDGSGKCGWYTTRMDVAVTLLTPGPHGTSTCLPQRWPTSEQASRSVGISVAPSRDPRSGWTPRTRNPTGILP